MPSTKPNRLALETSPYLLQHAHNPVDWYPWSEEAFNKAQAEQKPIFLSIGYSTCHWCHVMEKESFEDNDVAALLNEHFVPIKVDREERPDLDDVYMQATLIMSGQGGWPMSVFLTPDRKPFFAGTYFPKTENYGRMGFKTLLEKISNYWVHHREPLLAQALALTAQVQSLVKSHAAAFDASLLDKAFEQLKEDFDPHFGGFGLAPKFPPSMSLEFLLRYFKRTGERQALQMVEKTLLSMGYGGIYDQIGGGFARYSTDAYWLVPHFEKMLYDNALLTKIYLFAFQVTKNPEFKRIASETLDFVCLEMTAEKGGYYTAFDADSEGVEGKYFVWTKKEIEALLAPNIAAWFCTVYNVTAEGNFEGANILHLQKSLEEHVLSLGVELQTLEKALSEARALLYQERLKRIPPLCDTKIILGWNALMISAMAYGSFILQEPKYLDSAICALDFLLKECRTEKGQLLHCTTLGFLSDYAYFIQALIDVFEISGHASYLHQALTFAEEMLQLFGDDLDHGFFNTSRDHEALLVRMREGHDSALPSANALAALVLARLGRHFNRDDLNEKAKKALDAYGKNMQQAPRAYAQALCTADFMHTPSLELALVGENLIEFKNNLAEFYLPNRLLALGAWDAKYPVPLLENKEGSQPTLYICQNFACQKPITHLDEIKRALITT